eukprot:Tamp_06005.p1 GENE.Tamp_06005~~Tamp_06005.p1  ORF type:complete len:734 (-),score=146.39 Tamp_06005:608-2809(-)
MVDGWSAAPPPVVMPMQPQAGYPSSAQQLPPNWERKFTADGRAYYENHNDHTTHWEPPAAPAMANVSGTVPQGGGVDGWGAGASSAAPTAPLARSASMSFLHPENDRHASAADLAAVFTRHHDRLQVDTQHERIKYNKDGNPYIAHTDDQPDLFNMEVPADLSIFCSDQQLGEIFGPQITQYFNFLYFVIFTNLLFFGIALISFVPHALKTNKMLETVGSGFLQSGTRTSDLDLLFLASYQPSSDGTWYAMLALASLLSFLAGPLYLIASTFIFKDYIGATEREIPPEFNEIEENSAREVKDGYLRRLLMNYPIFIFCCFLPGVIMYLVLFQMFYAVVQTSYNEGQKGGGGTFVEAAPLIITLVPSAIVSISNIAFGMVVNMLNNWDKHPTWDKFRHHRMAKVLIFRIINIMFLFTFKFYSDMPFYTCITQRISFQVFTFVLMDITINNFVEMFLPGILSTLFGKKGDGEGEEAEEKPEFELSEEYFEITYRQFIMYMGVSVFPMITGITLLCNIVEILVDRYRLIKVCAKPKGMVPGGRRHLFVQLLVAAVCGLVAFPCGGIWFAGGYLCWPCPQYSAASTLDVYATLQEYSRDPTSLKTQVCNNTAAFEEPTCTLADGRQASVAEIRMHVDRLKGWEAFSKKELEQSPNYMNLYRQSQEFMSKNFQALDQSKRCACSPCVNVKSCNCGDRALEGQCRLESPRHCVDPSTGEVQRKAKLPNGRQERLQLPGR